MGSGNAHEWLAHIRAQLYADVTFRAYLAADASNTNVALYTSMLSAVEEPRFPCVTLQQALKTHPAVRTAQKGILQVDVYCPDAQQAKVTAPVQVGKNGCGIIYGRARQLLHNGHLRVGSPLSATGWQLKFLLETSRDDSLFVTSHHAFHLMAQYSLVLNECGAAIQYGVRP